MKVKEESEKADLTPAHCNETAQVWTLARELTSCKLRSMAKRNLKYF